MQQGKSVERLHSLAAVVSLFFQAEDGIRNHCVTGVQTWLFRSSESNSMLPSRSSLITRRPFSPSTILPLICWLPTMPSILSPSATGAGGGAGGAPAAPGAAGAAGALPAGGNLPPAAAFLPLAALLSGTELMPKSDSSSCAQFTP